MVSGIVLAVGIVEEHALVYQGPVLVGAATGELTGHVFVVFTESLCHQWCVTWSFGKLYGHAGHQNFAEHVVVNPSNCACLVKVRMLGGFSQC